MTACQCIFKENKCHNFFYEKSIMSFKNLNWGQWNHIEMKNCPRWQKTLYILTIVYA